MDFMEVLFGLGGWIVATLVIVIRIRNDRLHRERVDRLEGHVKRLIRASEEQREPLNKLVAWSKPGSETRDEAVSALRIANTAAEEVIRISPKLKPEGYRTRSEAGSPPHE